MFESTERANRGALTKGFSSSRYRYESREEEEEDEEERDYASRLNNG
jgi:hypothetical protein